MSCRGSSLNDDIFATLRFNQRDETEDVMIDIYRLPSSVMSTCELSPSALEFYALPRKVARLIHPGHSVQMIIPRSISHHDGHRNWALLEELQISYRGSFLNDNIFITFRFDQRDDTKDVMIDIYRMSS